MKIIFSVFAFLLYHFSISQNVILENYVREGLEKNLALKQKEFNFKKSFQSVQEAKGHFYPKVSLEARYSLAQGGRRFVFSADDVVTPVYESLNDYLTGLLLPPADPVSLEDQEFFFLRKHEHDTKLRLLQPVVDPRIWVNLKIQKELMSIEQAERDVYKRKLVLEIKETYYNHLIATQVVSIYENAKKLLNEYLRVKESLVKNHKALPAEIYRVKAEISDVEAKLADAEKDYLLSASFFNFLINRPFTEVVKIDSSLLDPEIEAQVEKLDFLASNALMQRNEVMQMDHAMNAADRQINLKKTGYWPTLYGVFDYGFEGEKYRFTSEDDYWIGSVLLQWNLFDGMQTKAQVQQSKIEKESLQTKREEVMNQIQLEVGEAFYKVGQTRKKISASEFKLESAEKNYEMIQKRYEQNVVPHIEFLDATTTLSQAQIELVIAKFNYLIELAKLEHVTANYSLN